MPANGYYKKCYKLAVMVTGLLLILTFFIYPSVASTSAEYIEVIKLQHAEDVVSQYDVVNISLTIINVYNEPLRNASFTDEYNNDLMFVQDSLNNTHEYNESTDSVSWQWDIIQPDETVSFWALINFTANESHASIAIQPTNITFKIEYGIPVTVYSNPLSIIYEYNPGGLEGVDMQTRIEGTLDIGIPVLLTGLLFPVFAAMFVYVINVRREKS